MGCYTDWASGTRCTREPSFVLKLHSSNMPHHLLCADCVLLLRKTWPDDIAYIRSIHPGMHPNADNHARTSCTPEVHAAKQGATR